MDDLELLRIACERNSDDIANLYKVADPYNLDSYDENHIYYFHTIFNKNGYTKNRIHDKVGSDSPYMSIDDASTWRCEASDELSYCLMACHVYISYMHIISAYVLDDSLPSYVLK
jgi:hypothetical protein